MSIHPARPAALAALLAAALAAPALPQPSGDPIALRQAEMKNVGFAAGLGGAMLKNEAPFDARVAQAVLVIMQSSAIGYGFLFPEGSTGPTSAAKDTIWTDRAGFDAAVAKFVADTTAAVAAKPADLAAFQAQFAAVTKNCGSCHEAYRIKRN